MFTGLAPAPLISTESHHRRANHRYPISMELTYWVVTEGNHAGVGRTLDMSSRGICCSGLGPLRAGGKLEVSLSWPVSLGSCPLKLVIVGRVLRSDAERTAIAILKYQFRTRRSEDAKTGESAQARQAAVS
jgi:hypothetical protein